MHRMQRTPIVIHDNVAMFNLENVATMSNQIHTAFRDYVGGFNHTTTEELHLGMCEDSTIQLLKMIWDQSGFH